VAIIIIIEEIGCLGNCENKREEEISVYRNYKIRRFLTGEGDKIERN
jgi:hypothetical protein